MHHKTVENDLKKLPLVSVVVVNWNGRKWLKNCFDSLQLQSYKNLELIFVDNNSNDGSIFFIEENYPKVHIISSTSNLGFTGGNNLGFKHAKGKYIYMLNNDTVLNEKCIEHLVAALELNDKIASVQSKMKILGDESRLDIVGSFWTSTGFLYHFGSNGNSSLKKYDVPMRVFSNKGASMMLRSEAISKVGTLDEDFWCYYEETDLCNRLWLAGYECWYEPSAVMLHAGGGTALTFENSFIQFHNFKNKLLSFLKCMSVPTLFSVLPVYLLFTFLLSFYWLLKGRYKHFIAIYKAYVWNLRHLKTTLQKRRLIQRQRVVTDLDIFKMVKKNPPIGYYKALLAGGLQGFDD